MLGQTVDYTSCVHSEELVAHLGNMVPDPLFVFKYVMYLFHTVN